MIKHLWVGFLLGAVVVGQTFPASMTKLTIRLQPNRDVPSDTFATKPKTMYRAASIYCRIEESPDPAKGMQRVIILNGPDAWIVNLLKKSAQHFVDPGPTFNCHLPVFPGERATNGKDSLAELEFGNELSYFRGKAARRAGPVLRNRSTNAYAVEIGDSQLFLFTAGEPEMPWVLTRERGNRIETYWYEIYDELPFDPRLFNKPREVRIEETK
jgi:hypothetical protein